MSTAPPRGEIHGRDAELDLIRDELSRSARGRGAVLILEGGAGMGKSRLLSEAIAIGRELGTRAGLASAEPGDSVVELATLLSALFDGSEPLLDRRDLLISRAEREHRYWLLRDLQSLLERAALGEPLMICIDDAQWADSGTAAALRALPAELTGLPIAWLIATRPLQDATPVPSALEHLKLIGAETITLGPLPKDAVTDLAADLLGACPDDAVLDLIEEADGTPFLVVDLILGLNEEARLRIDGGRAALIDGSLPNRIREGMRARLERMTASAANAATVAASLGHTFSVAELARTLDVSPATLLQPINELLSTSLLVERGDKLAFWHDITREAVRGCVPTSMRRALDRQAAGVLLASGALPVDVAVQLAASAESGDEVAITALLDAAQTLATTDPVTAARFARRALELAPRGYPRRGEIVATTAIALHVAGNSEDAIAFADAALRQNLQSEQEAEVRLSIAGMFSISTEMRLSAGRAALALPGLSEVVRARHLACLVHNLVTSGRMREARATLDEAWTVVGAARDVGATFTLHAAESGLDYGEERFERGLALVTKAHREGASAGDDQRLRLVHMWRGEHLGVLDRHEEAFAIAADGLNAARQDRQGWADQMFETFRARMLLRAGQLSEARAILEGRFATEDGSRVGGALEAAGVAALGTIALHVGDTREVRRLGDAAQIMIGHPTLAVRRHAAWLLALIALAEGDVTAARAWVRTPSEPGEREILPRIPIDVTDEVPLARIARAAQDDELRALAVANALRRAELNPGVASIQATAAHVRGLAEDDPAELERAVSLFAASPRPLALASALEDLGVARWPTDQSAGIDALSRALVLYSRAEASWDERRVRRRLRGLGVRRRMVTPQAPTVGWESLTDSEISVARLVADGLTNREVSERLFVSPHTVNGHLRHVFIKLGISSRVELARLVADQPRE